VLEPDHTARVVPTHPGAPGGLAGPHALQILTTEHWSLLAARSLGYTEAMSRASLFIAALSGAVIALALVGQATDFGTGFVAFALVLLPVVYFLGLSTVVRLGQVNYEDAVCVQGMNRIRNAYLELAPELEPYFVTSRYDDERGVLQSAFAARSPISRLQPFVAIPGVVVVIDSVVAGAVAGIAGLGLDLGVGGSLVLGGVAFVTSLLSFAVWARRAIARYVEQLVVRFPTPVDGDAA
jgi:hypothetical protein